MYVILNDFIYLIHYTLFFLNYIATLKQYMNSVDENNKITFATKKKTMKASLLTLLKDVQLYLALLTGEFLNITS